MALQYCKKCGRIARESYNNKGDLCDCCGSKMYNLPAKYLDEDVDCLLKNGKETKQIIYEELVKPSPEFDQEAFNRRDEIIAKHRAEYREMMEINKAVQNGVKFKDALGGVREAPAKPKCPSCGSTNISKIGVINRTISVGLFGLASSKIGKTHKCNNCGTTW